MNFIVGLVILYGIALHCGRSGAVVLDVDRPELIPADWWCHLDTAP